MSFTGSVSKNFALAVAIVIVFPLCFLDLVLEAQVEVKRGEVRVAGERFSRGWTVLTPDSLQKFLVVWARHPFLVPVA